MLICEFLRTPYQPLIILVVRDLSNSLKVLWVFAKACFLQRAGEKGMTGSKAGGVRHSLAEDVINEGTHCFIKGQLEPALKHPTTWTRLSAGYDVSRYLIISLVNKVSKAMALPRLMLCAWYHLPRCLTIHLDYYLKDLMRDVRSPLYVMRGRSHQGGKIIENV